MSAPKTDPGLGPKPRAHTDPRIDEQGEERRADSRADREARDIVARVLANPEGREAVAGIKAGQAANAPLVLPITVIEELQEEVKRDERASGPRPEPKDPSALDAPLAEHAPVPDELESAAVEPMRALPAATSRDTTKRVAMPVVDVAVDADAATVQSRSPNRSGRPANVVIGFVVLLLVALAAGGWWFTRAPADAEKHPTDSATPPTGRVVSAPSVAAAQPSVTASSASATPSASSTAEPSPTTSRLKSGGSPAASSTGTAPSAAPRGTNDVPWVE